MKKTILLLLLILPLGLFAGLPHKTHSILMSGKWFRISLQTTGIYKITYQDFQDMGFDPANMDPSKIRICGNGSGILPETNTAPRPDDLTENSIFVQDGGDGKFDPGDYVLFYGEGPDQWVLDYDSRRFSHIKNLYSDSTYYFVTVGTQTGKRVQPFASLDSVPDYTTFRFLDHAVHDVDSVNLTQSGKTWFGESFTNNKNEYTLPFSFPNADSGTAARIVTHFAAKSTLSSLFKLTDSKNFSDSVSLPGISNPISDTYASEKTTTSYLLNPKAVMNIRIHYSMNEPSANGWLDYIEVHCERKLTWTAPQMTFREPTSVRIPVTEFRMNGSNPSVIIWDVTHRNDIRRILPVATDSTLRFRVYTDSLREFAGFDGSSFYPVHLSGPVPNQDLHNLDPPNMVIVTNGVFRQQADSLADFHRTTQGMTVDVVDVDQIFTEFACGQRDLTAIRDFMKMLYDRGYPDNTPRYLLLFGDGTYDPKNRILQNNNMIPPYESNEYLSSTTSYVSDDYYGILNDGDGGLMNGSIKVGIGRLPVVTAAQASVVLNKIERYYSLNDSTLADWKNTITFVADDPDGNYHLKQAEQLADTVRRKYPVFNVNKIYNDAYQMTSTPSGMRSPECEKAINKSVCNGGMVLSYTGHGGEEGWSSTKILTIPDINSWNNYYRLPVFITATCEFSRFDNPNRPTGGELVILKPDGGGVALFTTTRKAFGAANIQLSATFFSILMSVTDGLNPRLGDLIRVSKDSNNNSLYLRNFVLLGDPAVDILFARQKAVTTYINDHPLDGSPDTVLGLSKVTIRGEIQDSQGNKLTNFNGIVYPKVFDKPVTYSTIGNTPASYPQGFQLQNHVLFSGKSTVTHGDFQFTFFVPRGVALPFGKGKISYYAQDLQTDAKGYTTEMVVGGADSNADSTVKGPEIGMFMDSTTFVSGDRTGPDPVLLAFLNDNTGINHQDLGIGHDITAILDNDDSHPILLNSYFEPALDDYTSGSIHFPFAGLSPGFHSLRLKVWNVYDVSSEKEIYFWVMDQKLASIQNVKNYPNPFQTGTTFAFTPMNASGDLDVQVLIYAYTGQLVKTIQKHFTESSSTTSLIIEWDGNGDNGVPLHTGIYLYRVIIRGSNGTLAQTSQKLVILR